LKVELSLAEEMELLRSELRYYKDYTYRAELKILELEKKIEEYKDYISLEDIWKV
jgi:hypothetical protein